MGLTQSVWLVTGSSNDASPGSHETITDPSPMVRGQRGPASLRVPSACKDAAQGRLPLSLTSHPQLQSGSSGTTPAKQQTGRPHTPQNRQGKTQGHQLPTAPQGFLGFPPAPPI